MSGDVNARDAFELDDGLDQTGVAINHHIVVLAEEVLLDVVANFVENLGPHVATGPFDAVHLHFHVLKVPLLDALPHLLHARVQRHQLQAAKHDVVQIHIASQSHKGRHLVQRHQVVRVNYLILVLRNLLVFVVLFRHPQLI